jgi:hypothetical protein
MALISCWDCGHYISESASQCPKCRSYNPKGVQCMICGGRMKAKDSAMRFDVVVGYRTHMHRRCGAKLFRHRGHCNECGSVCWHGWFDWVGELGRSLHSSGKSDSYLGPSGGFNACKNCGALNPLNYMGSCSGCSLPVYRQLHEVSSKGVRHRFCENLHTEG